MNSLAAVRPAFTAGERDIFRRPPRISVSAWAAEHLIVPDGPYAGARYRRDVNPYLAPIMDIWGRPETERVMVCGSAQTGKTLLQYGCICYDIAFGKGPRMLAMPDETTMERVVEAKLRPLFRKTRPVRAKLKKIKASRVDFNDSTKLYLASAAAQQQRATVSIEKLFLDEEALFRKITGQGVPVEDFLERTRSYQHTHKVLRVSKPVGGEECTIIADMALMDEVLDWHAVCPACGTSQVLAEENVITELGIKDPARIVREKLGRYRCPHCKMHWSDFIRDSAVARGEWIPREKAHRPRRFGFHLPAVLSSVVSLSEIAAAKAALEKTDDAEKHQSYWNGYWAVAFKPVVAKAEKEQVLALVDKELEPETMPLGNVALTAYIDMQKRGFWYMVCAWTGKLDGAIIDYGRLKDWEDVYKLVFEKTYRVESSVPGEYEPDNAVIWRALLDTGGGVSENEDVTRTEEAYAFVAEHGNGVLFAGKGNAHKQTNPVMWTLRERMPKSRTTIKGGLQLYLLDTGYFKRWATARLTPEARQPFRLHSGCDDELAHQLTSEEQVVERGKRVWKQKKERNHLFDCLCGNLACVHATFTPSLARLVEGLEEQERARREAEQLLEQKSREGQRQVQRNTGLPLPEGQP